MPKAWTTPSTEPEYFREDLRSSKDDLHSLRGYRGHKVQIYTDGSGGRSTSDKRLRRCGWAWVVPRPGTNRDALYGARGALEGKQTVPRAELLAILTCLMDIKGHATIKNETIYSDCKMAVDGVAKGRQYTSKTKLGQLWASVWDGFEECLANGMHIEVLKVKSHENLARWQKLR